MGKPAPDLELVPSLAAAQKEGEEQCQSLSIGTHRCFANFDSSLQVMEQRGVGDIDWSRQAAFTVFGFAYLVSFCLE